MRVDLTLVSAVIRTSADAAIHLGVTRTSIGSAVARPILRQRPYPSGMGCALCLYRQDDLLVEDHADGALLADRAPMCFGHLLVVSSSHAASVADLSPAASARFLARVETARAVASAMTGRSAVAIEHGRSPTCGDLSCSCHAHVHVVPVGELDSDVYSACDFLSATVGPGDGPYLAVATLAGKRRFFRVTRPVAHAARTLAALAADAGEVPWLPMAAGGDEYLANATLRQARERISRGFTMKLRRLPIAHKGKPTIVVSGSTGSGKTTVARHLANWFEVPAIELGVILRLACLHGGALNERKLASTLWRWSQSSRVDFDGARRQDLAAAVPRLDGASHERLLWTEVEASRLSAMAQAPEIQDVLSAIALSRASRSGAVIVGRVPVATSGVWTRSVHLDAAPIERARRKRRQLAAIGLGTQDHDWFNPNQVGNVETLRTGNTFDTTRLSQWDMGTAALLYVHPEALTRLLVAS